MGVAAKVGHACAARLLQFLGRLAPAKGRVEHVVDRPCVGVVDLLQPQLEAATDRHGQHSPCSTPDGAPEGERHDDREGVHVQALRHDAGLHDAAQRVVDAEGHEHHKDGVPDAPSRVQQYERQGGQYRKEGADVRDEVEHKSQEAKDRHQGHAHHPESRHYSERHHKACDCLAHEVPLHEPLHPRAADPLVDTRQDCHHAEDEEQDRQEHAFEDAEHQQCRADNLALVVRKDLAGREVAEADARVLHGILEVLQPRRRHVRVPIEGLHRPVGGQHNASQEPREHGYAEEDRQDVPEPLQEDQQGTREAARLVGARRLQLKRARGRAPRAFLAA
mmetsp:Transcript_18136/g.57614  ORF Transcript_18136/g.57614 Transcript_18136/m.57614 type:complete len:334 (-) Transcript_18136:412-1413(-)